jgi:hypothetical protein
VRKVKGLAREFGPDIGPGLGLSCVGEEVHDDSSLADSLMNPKEVLARDPAVLDCIFPRSAVLSYT